MIKKLNHVTLTGVSLKAAEIGDILVTRIGLLMEYTGESGIDDYPHKVTYLNKKATKLSKKYGGGGTRTECGQVFRNSQQDSDIVMIISKHSWPRFTSRDEMIKLHKDTLKRWDKDK